MIRLMLTLFAFLWSAMLDTEGGGSGGDGGGSGSGGQGGGASDGGFTLTEAELTARTEKAANDKITEIAGVLGVDLSNTADVKALIEAGRKAQQDREGDGSEAGGKEGDGLDVLLESLENINKRIEGIETAEQQRQRVAAEQNRDEKLTTALKEANVRDDRLDAARTLALANGAKLNDKGELVGTSEAIEATKKALPEAFRGDGDDGKAADAGGREKTERKPKTLSEALTAHYSKS
jgi:hypothetical protein